MNRVVFLVDGFNVYHSLRQATRDSGETLKWLDLHALCNSYVQSSVFGKAGVLERVIYFSAYAAFLSSSKPGVVARHRTYVTALQATGVDVVMGRFKWKPRWCPTCKRETPGHEEKETDVSLAVHLIELFVTDACETAVLVTGDTDLLPAIAAARRLSSGRAIWIGFPYKRLNQELRLVADGHFRIRRQAYARHQLPDPLKLPDEAMVRKPAGW